MSLIEVADGQIADSESTVPVMNVQNVTASRSFGVNYTNITGKTLFVNLYISCNVASVGGNALITIQSPQVTVLGYAGIVSGGTPGETMCASVSLIVPPGVTYRFNDVSTGGTVSIQSWIELY